jgi:hypothetical protein
VLALEALVVLLVVRGVSAVVPWVAVLIVLMTEVSLAALLVRFAMGGASSS